MSTYAEFLATKRRVWSGVGGAPDAPIPSALYPWQVAIVRWAVRKGRAAIFADCGLGKTFMQVAWASALDVPTLILAPLCVAEQTVAEAARLGVTVRYATDQSQATAKISITNYERLDHFDPSQFQAVVLDESSILKAFNGHTRTALIEAFAKAPYRLCCTATPSPNDITELANHAEFLGLMTRPEFLATWFIRADAKPGESQHGWRMKRHAVEPFYRWMASWAVALRSPADIGYDASGFVLPPLTIHEEILGSASGAGGGVLFPELGVHGITGRLAARRTALTDRVERIQHLTNQHDDSWLLWCGLNEESTALAAAIPDAVEVRGDDTYAEKKSAVEGFVSGRIRTLITKPKILGFGMNFQHCRRMAFVGMSDSYETYYQCIRRAWRYGQKSAVDVHVVVSEAEKMVVENVRRKEAAAADLSNNLLKHMRSFELDELGAA